MNKCDLTLIIPQVEEFRVLCEICSKENTEIHDAIHYHTLKSPHSDHQIMAVVLGEMGKTRASQVAEKALGFLEPKLAVLVGIAGALDTDLKLGDLVVASEVNEFFASSKAVQKDKSYAFEYSGNHWKTTFAITNYIQNFEFTDKNLYSAWQNDVKRFQASLGLNNNKLSLTNTLPRLETGHVACGDTVVAAEAYAIELRGIDRKFHAIEMESAGFLQAADGREAPIRTMVVRGVSDFANEKKKELDSVGDGVWRRYAMYSAGSFLTHLLRAKSFQNLIECSREDEISKTNDTKKSWKKHY